MRCLLPVGLPGQASAELRHRPFDHPSSGSRSSDLRPPRLTPLVDCELREQESNLRLYRDPKSRRPCQQSIPERLSGRRAPTPLLRFGRPTCPPSSPRPPGISLRRPYGARTRNLLAENQVSCHLAPTAHRATPVRHRLRPEGTDAWSRRDSNPRPPVCRTGALPAELQPHVSGTGVSNPVSLAPKASGSAVSLVPEVVPPAGPDRRRPGSCSCHPLWS